MEVSGMRRRGRVHPGTALAGLLGVAVLAGCGGLSVSGPTGATVTVTVTATPSPEASSPTTADPATTTPGATPSPSDSLNPLWPDPSDGWGSTSGEGGGTPTVGPPSGAPGGQPSTTSRFSGQVTPPGTVFTTGDPAVVKLTWQDRQTAVRVVPMRIERASGNENDALRAGPAAGRPGVGWFVTVDVTNLDEWRLQDAPLFLRVDATDRDGRRLERLTWVTDQGRCPSKVVSLDPNQTASTCSVFWVPEGASVEELAFHWDYSGAQIRWRRPGSGPATSGNTGPA